MKKLYRSTRDKKLLGVCGGLAEYFEVDSTVIRIIMLIALFCSFGFWIFVYLIAGLIMPIDPGYTDV